ncbi:hypothetical protein KM043_000269 [Ampulex compressa]|nr:hypothetical protein KM043_000269 [Ampulex compressa]
MVGHAGRSQGEGGIDRGAGTVRHSSSFDEDRAIDNGPAGSSNRTLLRAPIDLGKDPKARDAPTLLSSPSPLLPEMENSGAQSRARGARRTVRAERGMSLAPGKPQTFANHPGIPARPRREVSQSGGISLSQLNFSQTGEEGNLVAQLEIAGDHGEKETWMEGGGMGEETALGLSVGRSVGRSVVRPAADGSGCF